MRHSHHETLYRYELNHWWYRVRRELVHSILQNHFGDRTDLRLADIGCGTGALTKELERYGECVGIDASAQAVAFCRSRGVRDVRLGSAEKTGLESASFDVVLCLDVLEHLPDDAKGIAEMGRVLKSGGIAIIFVPTFMFLWGSTDDISHHYRRYRLPALAKKFTTRHFTILRRSYFNILLFLPIACVRLLNIPLRSETETDSRIVNGILYHIFRLERTLLRYSDLPFGVSGLLVVQKNDG